MKIALRVPQKLQLELSKYSDTLLLEDNTIDLGSINYYLAPWEKGQPRKTEYLIHKAIEDHIYVIGMWEGFKRDLVYLETQCSLVALPWYRPRTLYLNTPEDSKEYIYYGFRSLDELRRFPPKVLITDMPVRAAINGIDLTSRERRPKLDPLPPGIVLSKEQIEQTVKNLLILRKAAKGMV